ncbi:hypothetical protein ACFWI9_28040, partial [Streptomyces sp. NPDC127084]
MSNGNERLAPLRWLAIERAAGHQVGSNRLIDAGLEALLAGVDSPSLPLLAGLGVLPRDVGQPGDGWFAAGCGVGAVVIVVMEP